MKKQPVTKTVPYRSTPEYAAGKRAFADGKQVDDHALTGAEKTAWLYGWYDARTMSRIGNILNRYGHTWP